MLYARIYHVDQNVRNNPKLYFIRHQIFMVMHFHVTAEFNSKRFDPPRAANMTNYYQSR